MMSHRCASLLTSRKIAYARRSRHHINANRFGQFWHTADGGRLFGRGLTYCVSQQALSQWDRLARLCRT